MAVLLDPFRQDCRPQQQAEPRRGQGIGQVAGSAGTRAVRQRGHQTRAGDQEAARAEGNPTHRGQRGRDVPQERHRTTEDEERQSRGGPGRQARGTRRDEHRSGRGRQRFRAAAALPDLPSRRSEHEQERQRPTDQEARAVRRVRDVRERHSAALAGGDAISLLPAVQRHLLECFPVEPGPPAVVHVLGDPQHRGLARAHIDAAERAPPLPDVEAAVGLRRHRRVGRTGRRSPGQLDRREPVRRLDGDPMPAADEPHRPVADPPGERSPEPYVVEAARDRGLVRVAIDLHDRSEAAVGTGARRHVDRGGQALQTLDVDLRDAHRLLGRSRTHRPFEDDLEVAVRHERLERRPEVEVHHPRGAAGLDASDTGRHRPPATPQDRQTPDLPLTLPADPQGRPLDAGSGEP